MRPISLWIRTSTVSVALVLSATVASPQSVDEPQVVRAAQPSTGERPVAKVPRDMMARMAAVDERIEMLVAQMNSFTGEMKVTAMAALLTTLVERQSMMRDHMMQRQNQMTHRVTAPMTSSAPADADEADAGMMCSAQADPPW